MSSTPSASSAPDARAVPERRTSDAAILVHRSGPLRGEVVVPGAKNSVLKLMAATILADGEYHLRNVPDVGTLRCVLPELPADNAAAILGKPARVQGRYLADAQGRPRLMFVERIEPHQVQGHIGG